MTQNIKESVAAEVLQKYAVKPFKALRMLWLNGGGDVNRNKKTIIERLEILTNKYQYDKVCLNEIDYYEILISAIDKLKNLSNKIDKICVLPCSIGDAYWQYSEINKRINKYRISILQQK